MLMLKKNKREYIYIVISLLFVLSIDHYFFQENTLGTESMFNFLLLICIYKLQIYAVDTTNALQRRYGFLYGFILSCALTLGRCLYTTNRIADAFFPVKNFAFFMISVISFTVVLGFSLAIVFKYLANETYLNNNNIHIQPNSTMISHLQHKYIFFLLWLLIFLSWIPAYLAYYPGILSYDMISQTKQALGIVPFSRYHPPLHTFFWACCIHLGEITGIEYICIYSILQMLFLSSVLAQMITFLVRKCILKWVIVLSITFVSLNPVVAIFSFVPTKDVGFAGFFVLTIISLIQLITYPPSNKLPAFNQWSPFVLFATLSCLFRNNAIYVYILLSLVIVLFFTQYRTKYIVIFLLPILFFYMINGPVYSYLGIRPGNSREMLSVPIQQIADVVTYESYSLSEETKGVIDKYIPYDSIVSAYNPRFADPVKDLFQTEVYDQDSIGFYGLWFNLLCKYPDNYISAFLSLNLPYWYPDACSIDDFSKRIYIETNIYQVDFYSFERQSKLPILLSFYEIVASYDAFKNVPLLSNIFSISTPIWVLVGGLFVILLKKERKGIIVLAPQLLLWFTYLAGPVSNFRYIFPIFILYPISLTLILDPHNMLKE